MSTEVESNNPEEILGNYKRMMAECQQIAAKISEVSSILIFLYLNWFSSPEWALSNEIDLNLLVLCWNRFSLTFPTSPSSL